jgi:hypothetical protein
MATVPQPVAESFDLSMQEDLDGISFSWNTWPTTRIEPNGTVPIGLSKLVLPTFPKSSTLLLYPNAKPFSSLIVVLISPLGHGLARFTLLLLQLMYVVLSCLPATSKLLCQYSTWKYAVGVATTIHDD